MRGSRCLTPIWVSLGTRISGGLLLVLLAIASDAFGQAVPGADTLVLMSFENGVQPDYARGSDSVSLRGGEIVPRGGRFGDGLRLPAGSSLELVGNDGNLNPSAGTVEFWIKPSWPGSDEDKHSLFSASVSKREYLNINTLGTGRLGIAMAAGEGDDFRWRRADGDTSAWKANAWRHVAFTWGDGELSLFLDGKETDKWAPDSLMLQGLPEKLTLLGCDAILDDFQIHDRRYQAKDVAEAIAMALDPPYKLLDTSDLKTSGKVERGGMTILGNVRLPLAFREGICSRGLAAGDGAEVSFLHEAGTSRFHVTYGVSCFAAADTRCRFEIWLDDRLEDSSEALRAGEATHIMMRVTGRKRIRLKVTGTAMRDCEAIWAFPVLIRDSASESVVYDAPFRPLSEKRLDMYRRQMAADDYHGKIESARTWIVCKKHWADDVDVDAIPKPMSQDEALTVAAAPGEYEPVNFMVYAIDAANEVRVSVSELKGENGAIPAGACDVRLALRRLMRKLYTLPPEASTVVSRFLLPNQAVDIPAGTFREYHTIVHVPEDQPAGEYRGTVTIATEGGESRDIPLVLQVRPVRLGDSKPNLYGMYYRFPRGKQTWEGLDRELADIHQHGGRMLKSDLGLDYAMSDGGVVVDTSRLRRGLKLLADHDYAGPMPISTGAESVCRLLKYDPVADYDDQAAREEFFAAVAKGMKALEKVNGEFPQFDLMATHMDEVLGRDRLPRYVRLTEAVRRATDLPVYITLHNDPRRDLTPLLQEIRPYVDVRCYNGHAMDNWIQAGNTFADLEQDMAALGDEAWIYHNIRGSFFPAEWTRLVNGFYLWISPIKVHVPWMYYSYHGNPMDCTDGPQDRGGDFAYAVPDPDDADAMIPTRHWEAYREGVDDMRYLRSLERLVEAHAGTAQADRAEQWLAALRQRLTPTHEQLQKIETESPLLVYLAAEFDGPDYRRFREQAAELIAQLQSLDAK